MPVESGMSRQDAAIEDTVDPRRLPGGDSGFWVAQELAGLRRESRALGERLERMETAIGDLRIQTAGKLDKDDFYRRMDRGGDPEKTNRAMMEVLKILGASIGAAVSALTGVKLLQ
ncbi:MAG: hypothetical protein M5R36_26135 [Deltaproteobacteria bacterium]|nr:hypothetical protein [Deltaproteobacteria bacterium]